MTKAEEETQERLIQAVCRKLVGSFVAMMLEDGMDEETVYRVTDKALKDSKCPMVLERLQVIKRTQGKAL